jgi:hypothetical protein
MKTRKRLFITQCFMLLLSCSWMASAQAQKVVVSEAIPNNAEQGTVSLDVQIKGRGFQNGANVAFWRTGTENPGGITVNAVTVHDSKNLTANIDVDESADVDLFDIEVFNTNGRKGKGITLFTVKLKGGGPNDTTPPAPIQDFRVGDPVYSSSVTLRWTASGDDGNSGSIDHYVLRQAVQTDPTACDGSGPYDFGNAETLDPPPTSPAGWVYEFPVDGLMPDTCYAFELEPFDDVGNTPGPSFTAAHTITAPVASGWQQEQAPPSLYLMDLQFNPDMAPPQPVIFGGDCDSNIKYLTRSTSGSWSSDAVKNGVCPGYSSLAYNPIARTFVGLTTTSRNQPLFAELLANGNWQVTQVTRDRVRFSHQGLAVDANGTPTFVYRNNADKIVRIVSYDGSSFSTESTGILGWEPHLVFQPPAMLQPLVVNVSDDGQAINLATYDGNNWTSETLHLGNNIGSDIAVAAVAFDPNNEPVIIFRQALDTFYEYWARMLRKEADPNDPTGQTRIWVATNIDSDGLFNQNVGDMVFGADGTLYVVASNSVQQVRVGRHCAPNQGFACEAADGSGAWYWENISERENSGGSLAITLDPANGEIIVGHATGTVDANLVYRCDPSSTSVICGNAPPP